MPTGTSLGRGGVAGGLWNCCLAVLVVALLLVCGFWVWVARAPRHNESVARDDMRKSVAASTARLKASAADGVLLGTEIDRDVAGAPVRPLPADVRRRGRTVTVTARFMGVGPGFMGSTEVTGCYRFRIVPPEVSVREVPAAACRDLRHDRRPAVEIARDVVAELREALADGGPEAVGRAAVWQTPGIRIQDQETVGGRSTVLAWVGTGTAGSDCYAFAVDTVTVTAKEQSHNGCYRIEREQQARDEATRRAELDTAAREIEHRIDHALTDGRLTDTELADALDLPRTDTLGKPAPRDPVAVAVHTRRSATGVRVEAKVNALDQSSWNEGCYEFTVRPRERSVTRRATGTACLVPTAPSSTAPDPG
ncbi:hypothetical protein [Streptomyces sp. NPDC020298]|uniref:hypothetical protein n=1 Tax=unclassified Streptomyces TaxID=2593676 RepID=UPI0033E7C66E